MAKTMGLFTYMISSLFFLKLRKGAICLASHKNFANVLCIFPENNSSFACRNDKHVEWMKYDFSCFLHLDQGRRSCPVTSCIISRKLTIIASIIWTICLKSELTTALYLGPFFCFLYLYQQVFFESPEIRIQLSVKTKIHSTDISAMWKTYFWGFSYSYHCCDTSKVSFHAILNLRPKEF